MWQWIVCNSAGLQAVGAIVAALFAIAGFVVLCVYAWDTKTIAKAASHQTKDNFIAFLALSQLPRDGKLDVLQWKIQNMCSGPAINIRSWLPGKSTPRQRPSLMKEESFVICDVYSQEGLLFAEQLKSSNGFKIEYESLAGEKFRSTFKVKDVDTVVVEFENLSRL
jgi:hypothetical protein